MTHDTTAMAEVRPATAAPPPGAGSGSSPATARTRRTLFRRVRALGRGVLPVAAFLLVLVGGWQIVAARSGSVLIPDVPTIWSALTDIVTQPLFYDSLGATLLRVGLGFALAFATAVVVGIAMGRVEFVRRFFEPAVLIGLTVPGLVWALLCVIWFGVSLTNPVVAVALSAAPALTLSIYQGTRATDSALREMAHVYRFSIWTSLRYLWLPSLLPALFSGARLGLSLAWKVIVLVEMFGMSSGVGYELNNQFAAQNVAGVLSWTLLFAAVLAVLEYGVLQSLERRLGRWRKATAV
ncbi:ABC transporter permease [Streptomyces malaysiensis]|uniref:Sulfonate ABC transporter permease n=1 Tax=Streptomyces malaysiensis TaxID=92644 RepID=A0A7X5WYQ2_STRMQ|nr:ABC transporter permease [Streptomyces malaysiensis]NIY62276.1 sulfonate ABC transporter permease [Streptomyces malaysiensis]